MLHAATRSSRRRRWWTLEGPRRQDSGVGNGEGGHGGQVNFFFGTRGRGQRPAPATPLTEPQNAPPACSDLVQAFQ
jgi:hypothetical protein